MGMDMTSSWIKRFSVTASLALSMSACDELPLLTTAGNSTIGVFEAADPTRTVCDPLGGSSGSGSIRSGLKASLSFIPNGSTSMYSDVESFFRRTTHVDADLYFNQLYVPTRAFDRGFVTQSGFTIQNQEGNTLYEFFGLNFESSIRLGSTDQPGLYQFAILSDDGSIMEIDEGNGFNTIVSNDADHPTRMGCATRAVDFSSRDVRMPMKLAYYQGPRYHIALTLLWRKVNPGQSLSDARCGQSGNGLFWDSTVDPSIAQDAFIELLSRGWKVLGPDNYVIPDNEHNPCQNPGGGNGGGNDDGVIGV